MKRVGWIRLSIPGDKCGTHWRHVASGWEVMHCGHPTANWPYRLVDPSRPRHCTVSVDGHGFRRLDIAMDVVERVLRSELVVTTERCERHVARVLVGALGEAVTA